MVIELAIVEERYDWKCVDKERKVGDRCALCEDVEDGYVVRVEVNKVGDWTEWYDWNNVDEKIKVVVILVDEIVDGGYIEVFNVDKVSEWLELAFDLLVEVCSDSKVDNENGIRVETE